MRLVKLKTDPGVFQDSWDGIKDYEIRFDDRRYSVGDQLILLETRHSGTEMASGKCLRYTGRYMIRRVTSKLKGAYGLTPGWCVMGVTTIQVGDNYVEGMTFDIS